MTSAATVKDGSYVRWIRRLVRLIAMSGLLLFGIGILASRMFVRSHLPLTTSVSTVRGDASQSASASSSKTELNSRVTSDANATGADSSGAGSSGGDAADTFADTASASYESPLIRALGAVVVQNEQVFGEASDPIEQSLIEGDRILSNARSANRSAIRQANRQVRLPGRSPHVLIMLVEGLAANDLGCYGNASRSTPHVDSLARSGSRLTHFATDVVSSDVASSTRSTDRSASPFGSFQTVSTPRLLWDSGYTTFLIGDCSHPWATDDAWDHILGWKSKLVDNRPTTVESNGRVLRLTKSGANDGARFDDILVDEVASLCQSTASRRPMAIVLTTPLAWWHSGASDGTQADAVVDWDRFCGRVLATLDRTVGKGRTIVVVAGSLRPTANEKLELTEGGVPLLFAWPGHIPVGNVIEKPAGFDDLSPTIARLIGSTRAK